MEASIFSQNLESAWTHNSKSFSVSSLKYQSLASPFFGLRTIRRDEASDITDAVSEAVEGEEKTNLYMDATIGLSLRAFFEASVRKSWRPL